MSFGCNTAVLHRMLIWTTVVNNLPHARAVEELGTLPVHSVCGFLRGTLGTDFHRPELALPQVAGHAAINGNQRRGDGFQRMSNAGAAKIHGSAFAADVIEEHIFPRARRVPNELWRNDFIWSDARAENVRCGGSKVTKQTR